MRWALLVILTSCAHVMTVDEVERGLRECSRACKINNQPMTRYNLRTGACECGENPQVDM